MELTDQELGWLDGEGGAARQWAMRFNRDLGLFFGAARMLPIASAHFAPDIRMGGNACVDLLKGFVDADVKIAVPGHLDPCHIDFEKQAEIVSERGVPQSFIDEERTVMKLCTRLGFRPTQTCIPYQSLSPPVFGSHLAWGDTGAAICANAICGARTNFEGGPSALASALIGRTPSYGLHLPENRRGNLLIEIRCAPTEIADWGAIAILSSRIAAGYETVPIFFGEFARPSFAMIKQLGVALASYGSHAMFHVVGVTPEAASLDDACQADRPSDIHTIRRSDLDGVFAQQPLSRPDVDLVVFAAPQLGLDEVETIIHQLANRRVHQNTRCMMAVDFAVKAQADEAGLTKKAEALGAEFTTGTCFYPEAPLMRTGAGWRSVVTNSAKLINTLASAGYETALRRLDDCLDAAVTGKLTS